MATGTRPRGTVGRLRLPTVAATLSLLFPGLGQYAAGDRRRGVLVAMPALVLLVGVLGFVIGTAMGGGPTAVLDVFLSSEALVGIVVLDLALLAYHLFSITDAWWVARRASVAVGRRTGPLAAAGLAAVLAVATLGHAWVAAVGSETEQALEAVFVGEDSGPDEGGLGADGEPAAGGDQDDWTIPEPSFDDETSEPPPGASPVASPWSALSPSPSSPGSAAPTEPPTPTPSPLPMWARDGRLNLLLVGSDAGAGRWLLRTDTMILLSVDVESGRAAMFGIPRNLVNVPLPPESARHFANGRYPRMLNSLYVYATGHPTMFPGGEARGFRALTGAVQQLVGVRLDGFVAVDLLGFVKLVDAFDGLWIRIPKPLYDARYPKVSGTGSTTISFKAGCQRLGGGEALAYARSRHQDSDYGRMRRQQLVLLALRRQLDPPAVLERAPKLLRIARDHLWTTIKRKDLASLAELAARVKPRNVERIFFTPPTYPEYLDTASIRQIRRTVRQIFDDPPGEEAEEPGGSGSGSSSEKSCPP